LTPALTPPCELPPVLCPRARVAAQFEACMALTNLGSIGSAPKRRILAEKGLSALENCQFSENLMIRRWASRTAGSFIAWLKGVLHLGFLFPSQFCVSACAMCGACEWESIFFRGSDALTGCWLDALPAIVTRGTLPHLPPLPLYCGVGNVPHRSATEALANLSTTPEGVALVSGK
jgi:hypothetical protein